MRLVSKTLKGLQSFCCTIKVATCKSELNQTQAELKTHRLAVEANKCLHFENQVRAGMWQRIRHAEQLLFISLQVWCDSVHHSRHLKDFHTPADAAKHQIRAWPGFQRWLTGVYAAWGWMPTQAAAWHDGAPRHKGEIMCFVHCKQIFHSPFPPLSYSPLDLVLLN